VLVLSPRKPLNAVPKSGCDRPGSYGQMPQQSPSVLPLWPPGIRSV